MESTKMVVVAIVVIMLVAVLFYVFVNQGPSAPEITDPNVVAEVYPEEGYKGEPRKITDRMSWPILALYNPNQKAPDGSHWFVDKDFKGSFNIRDNTKVTITYGPWREKVYVGTLMAKPMANSSSIISWLKQIPLKEDKILDDKWGSSLTGNSFLNYKHGYGLLYVKFS